MKIKEIQGQIIEKLAEIARLLDQETHATSSRDARETGMLREHAEWELQVLQEALSFYSKAGGT